MPSKVRITTTKKNAEMKKKRYFIRLRTSRLLSRVRRTLYPPASQPLYSITVGTDGLTQEQIDLLKELERKGLIPKITWIESSPNGFDDRMKFALVYLHSDEAKSEGCKMRHGYDYAWIKIAMDSPKMPERYDKHKYMSTPQFVAYIKSLGYKDIAGPKTINKAKAHAKWLPEINRIGFSVIRIVTPERQRRNKIALKFLEIINEV